MSWVEIHDDILGSKLRGLRKRLNCSDITAIGMLAVLWLWSCKNADETGYLANTERRDIAAALKEHVGNADADMIVDALVECGWIDDDNGALTIHDWAVWQKEALTLNLRRSAERERQHKYRMNKKEKMGKKKAETEQKTEKPEKIKFAQAVMLEQAEYDKLVSKYGESFTKSCIEILSNYKMSSGKKYQSDYYAILNWVVEEVKKRKPNLQNSNSSIDMEIVKKITNQYGIGGL